MPSQVRPQDSASYRHLNDLKDQGCPRGAHHSSWHQTRQLFGRRQWSNKKHCIHYRFWISQMLQVIRWWAHSLQRRQELDRNRQICVNQYSFGLRAIQTWWPRDNWSRDSLLLTWQSTLVRTPWKVQGREVRQHQEKEEGNLYRRALPRSAWGIQGVHALLPWPKLHSRSWLFLYHQSIWRMHEASLVWHQESRLHMEQEQTRPWEGGYQETNDECHQKEACKGNSGQGCHCWRDRCSLIYEHTSVQLKNGGWAHRALLNRSTRC